ncbi:hypothetical protein YC2023_017634 [Brassica napus]
MLGGSRFDGSNLPRVQLRSIQKVLELFEWFHVLQSLISLQGLLSRFTNTKKDAVSHASKVIFPSLNYWRKNLQRHYG